MAITHKSIFAKVKDYKGNPIDEYNKIESFIKTKPCFYHHTIYDMLKSNFQNCKLLRATFIDLDDCLNSINNSLETYKTSLFEYLDESLQDELLDSFLLYSEIIVCVYFVTYKYYIRSSGILNSRHFDNQLFTQLIEMLKNSLKSMNHDFKVIDKIDYEVVAFKCNPEAECVAEKSPQNLKDAIYYYLGVKEKDIDEKQNRLHVIINLTEPLLKKYKDNKLVSKVQEYVQLIRHPEIKKKENMYKWFYEDKSSYLDELFMLCIFVKEYDISNQTIAEFENTKKKYS